MLLRYYELAFAFRNAFATPCFALADESISSELLARRLRGGFGPHELKICRFLRWPSAFLQSELHKRRCTSNVRQCQTTPAHQHAGFRRFVFAAGPSFGTFGISFRRLSRPAFRDLPRVYGTPFTALYCQGLWRCSFKVHILLRHRLILVALHPYIQTPYF